MMTNSAAGNPRGEFSVGWIEKLEGSLDKVGLKLDLE